MILIKFAKEIKGSAKVGGHEGWINCESMQVGVGRGFAAPSGRTQREVSAPSVSEMVFSRTSDMASPELFYQACGGDSLGQCLIHLVQIAGNEVQVYGMIELEEAMVSSYSVSSAGDTPSESFAINFTKISFQFDTFDGKKVTTGTPKKWDLAMSGTY